MERTVIARLDDALQWERRVRPGRWTEPTRDRAERHGRSVDRRAEARQPLLDLLDP
jgi:hypothetical protein